MNWVFWQNKEEKLSIASFWGSIALEDLMAIFTLLVKIAMYHLFGGSIALEEHTYPYFVTTRQETTSRLSKKWIIWICKLLSNDFWLSTWCIYPLKTCWLEYCTHRALFIKANSYLFAIICEFSEELALKWFLISTWCILSIEDLLVWILYVKIGT